MSLRVSVRHLSYLAAILSLLLLWQVAAWLLPHFIMPGVLPTMGRLVKVVVQTEFLQGLEQSLMRLAIGYSIACLAGTVLGLFAGISRGFAVYLRGVISILQSIPPITWVPLLVILLGFGNAPIVVVIIVSSLFPMALSVMNATEGVNRTHIELARVMGASRRQVLTKVYAPESLPGVITGAQVAFGNAWRSLIAGEMVGGASAGLGWSISYAGQIADMQGMLVNIVVIGCIAAFIDRVALEFLKQRLLRYRMVAEGGGR